MFVSIFCSLVLLRASCPSSVGLAPPGLASHLRCKVFVRRPFFELELRRDGVFSCSSFYSHVGLFCLGATRLARPRSGCSTFLPSLTPCSLRRETQQGSVTGQMPLRLVVAGARGCHGSLLCVVVLPSVGPRPRPVWFQASLQLSYLAGMHHAHDWMTPASLYIYIYE